jgi:large subunit ribosomal protein L4
MPTAGVYDIENKKVADIDLNDLVFGATVNEDVIYQVVRMQMAAGRSGSACTKGRSEVSGGGKKPWKQKGTGRARAGHSRSPLWKGGGVIFGPKPRSFAFKLPKKVRRLALVSALSMKFKEERMTILRDFPMEEIKTKRFKQVMDVFGFKKTLFVIDEDRSILLKSSRNIKDVKMIRSEGVNVYDLLKYDHVVFLEQAVNKIQGVLAA